MLIGIIPKIKKNHTEYEFSVDLNLINFLYFVFPKSNCEIIYSKGFGKKIDILILSGGNDLLSFNKNKEHKMRFDLDFFFLKKAVEKNIPVIGICYGAQFLANFFKSSFKKIDNHVGKKHKIFMSDKSNESYVVNSFHNYGIKALGKELLSIYHSKDKYIECFKHEELKILGLMWHPERHLPFKNNDKKIIKKIL